MTQNNTANVVSEIRLAITIRVIQPIDPTNRTDDPAEITNALCQSESMETDHIPLHSTPNTYSHFAQGAKNQNGVYAAHV